MHNDPSNSLSQLAAHLRNAQHVVVLTGAGVSSESGVPTFRDALTGLWEKYNPEDLATPQAFARDPELVSRWYDERRLILAQCQPNAGHIALAQLQAVTQRLNRKFTLITQNVDRLHQAAGSTNVIELHGTLWLWRCTACKFEREERGPAFGQYPPSCPDCGAPRRPGVVWFNESLPADALLTAQRASAQCDVFLSIGTSSVVHPAASLVDSALRTGAVIAEINLASTPLTSHATYFLCAKSGELLPQLVAAAFDQHPSSLPQTP